MTSFIGKDWETLMSSYQKEFKTKESTDSELSSIFWHLKKLLERKSSMFWHTQAFDRYIKSDINPFGLRIQIFPTLNDVDNSFKKMWEENLNECTKNMMLLLIGEYNKRLLVLDKELEDIQNRLQKFKNCPSLAEHESRLKIHIDKFNKDILLKKDNKFWRDQLAFIDGQAYKWNQFHFKPTNKRQSNRAQRNMDSKVSDVSSNSSISVSSQNSRSSRKNKQRPQGENSTTRSPKKRTVDVPNPPSNTSIPSTTLPPNTSNATVSLNTSRMDSSNISVAPIFNLANTRPPLSHVTASQAAPLSLSGQSMS